MSSQLSLKIDFRETDLINQIKINKEANTFPEYILDIVQNLPIGDFIIGENEYIIERKSINDLCASITDGRFREQKQRLFDSIKDPSKIIYIIEGTYNKNSFNRIKKSTVDSAILNLIFKHQYKVIYTENIKHTYDTLLLLCKKIHDDTFKEPNDLLIEPVKLIKKSDKLNENVFINQLGVIHGVSINIAKKIKEKYHCMNDLINAFNTELNPDLLLSTIEITEKKKISIALSKKIYNCLTNKLDT